jgi:hypothetical protein
MSALQSEVYEAFRAIDVPEDKAMKAATALGRRDDDVISIKGELVSIKGELTLLKWMMGFVLALATAILLKLFMH